MEGLHHQVGIGYTGRMETAWADGPRMQVLDTYEAMSRAAADFILRELKRQPNLLLCVSAGATPTRTYQLLAARYVRQPRSFNRLRVLQIDEWVGLGPGDPATCAADLGRKLLEPLRIPRNRFMGFRTGATDPTAECARVRRWLTANGPIDLCILGLGMNGHVAINEPAEALAPFAHVAALAESSRNHAMLKELIAKPRYGLTLGMADILRSRRMILLVNGKRKSPALRRLMKREVTTRFPASFVWLHPDATVLCDREAAVDQAVCH
jgi:galactosamine-6-phosphate isomerase